MEILGILVAVVVSILIIEIFKSFKYNQPLMGIFVLAVLISVTAVGYKYFKVNNPSSQTLEVINEVVEEVGHTENIRITSNDDIEILIGEEWVNTSDIGIISTFTKDITIEYNGKEVRIMDSGIVSTLKVLRDIGIIREN